MCASERQYFFCIRNEGYAASLQVLRVYAAIDDPDAEPHGMLRIVDETGEDHLFPVSLFVPIEVPEAAAGAFAEDTTMATRDAREVSSLKKYETVVMSGQSTLRALLTMNGGATVAFLAFIGHMMETGSMPAGSGRLFIGAMQLFIWGTFSAVLAYGLIFLTNCLSRYDKSRATNWMFGATLIAGAASLGFFLAASWLAIAGFEVASGMPVVEPG